MLITTFGFVAAGLVGLCAWWVYGRIFLLGVSKGQSSRIKIFPPIWRRVSYKDRIELEDRHEV
jgi:hypothetical protein